jgi:hypothetical protein
MNPTEPIIPNKLLLERVRNAYSKIANGRPYAVRDQDLAPLFLAIWNRRKAAGENVSDDSEIQKEFVEVIETLHKIGVRGLIQDRPDEPKPQPKPWIDPISGQPLPPPQTVSEKSFLRTHDPALLDHYEAMAANPYQRVHALKEAESNREQALAFKYDADQHETNPWRSGNLSEQSQFAQRHPDLVEFYKGESQPVDLPWSEKGSQNLTVKSLLLTKSPRTHALVKDATRIQSEWRAKERLEAKREIDLATQRLKALETATT